MFLCLVGCFLFLFAFQPLCIIILKKEVLGKIIHRQKQGVWRNRYPPLFFSMYLLIIRKLDLLSCDLVHSKPVRRCSIILLHDLFTKKTNELTKTKQIKK